MAMTVEEITSICNHCDRAIPSSNIDLHYAHCSRNLEKCKVCGDMVPRKHAEEHYLNTHAPVACSLCSETMERDILDVHKGENCPQRIVTCEYCEFPLPAIDLFEHQEVCGNRTEYCNFCGKYIRLRDRDVHETTCNVDADATAGSSRLHSYHAKQKYPALSCLCWNIDTGIWHLEKLSGKWQVARVHASRRETRAAAENEPRPQRRAAPRPLPPRRQLLFTIAITGIAFILGSFFFQKKSESEPVN